MDYKNYLTKAEDLMVYLNEYIFVHKNNVPKLMDCALQRKREQVIKIFEEVMWTYILVKNI